MSLSKQKMLVDSSDQREEQPNCEKATIQICKIKRRTFKMEKVPHIQILVLCIVAFLEIVQTTSAYHHGNSLPYYEASSNMAGSRGHPQLMKWHYNQNDRDDEQLAPSQAHRRTSETDLEDGLEEEDDEDRDEYAKAGSTNQERYVEEPSYGESDRAARDGDDIEGFFDKHLGPQEAEERANAAEDADEIPIQELSGVVSGSSPRRRLAGGRDADGDQFEAAASSPLSNIFQSLLSHHKRPFIIHTTTEDDSPSSSSASNSDQNSQQSTSSSTPIGSSIRGNAATSGATAYVGGTPIAYFTPIAAPSNAYDQSGGPAPMTSEAGGSGGGQAEQEEYAPVREIYISRRPASIMNQQQQQQQQQYQAYGPPGHRLEHHSSNAYWRGAGRPTAYQAVDDQGGEYARYPVAASYAYQREPQAMAASPPPAEEEQTVSFGLSFGRRPQESTDEDSGPEEQSSVDEPSPYEPSAYNTRQLMRHSSSMRSYNNFNYPYGSGAAQNGYHGRHYQPMIVQQPQQQQHAQSAYHGARYHKDPSESTIQPVNYGQYSGSGNTLTPVVKDNQANGNQAQWLERQQLLADLDKQIKTSQQHRQQQQQPQEPQPQPQQTQQTQQPQQQNLQQTSPAATTPSLQYAHRYPGQQVNQNSNNKQQQQQRPDNDVDIYRSFHSEVDPYKSFTSSSRIVNEPTLQQKHHQQQKHSQLANNNNNNRVPSNAEASIASKNSAFFNPRMTNANNNNNNNNDHVGGISTMHDVESGANKQQNLRDHLLTGPVVNEDAQVHPGHGGANNNQANPKTDSTNLNNNRHLNHLRVRRDDADERDNDDQDDDGVWVDDDEDDDNRQQSSDLNETSQVPEQDEENQDVGVVAPPPPTTTIVTPGAHGYELSPDDLMIYPG